MWERRVDIYQTSLQHRRLGPEMLSSRAANQCLTNAGVNSTPLQSVGANVVRELEGAHLMTKSHCCLLKNVNKILEWRLLLIVSFIHHFVPVLLFFHLSIRY